MKKNRFLHKSNIVFFVSVFLFVTYLTYADEISGIVRNSMELCIYTIIPTLFPIMVISTFAGKLGVPVVVRRCLRIPLQYLLCLSGASTSVLLFGTTGGYTVGIKSASSASSSGRLSKMEARMSGLVSVSPGIGFTVLTVGESIFHSGRIGWLLYTSVMIGNLFCGIIANHIYNRIYSRNRITLSGRVPAEYTMKDPVLLSDMFIDVVRDSIKAVGGMCGWILLFSACSSLITTAFPYPIIRVFLEISDAVRFTYDRQDLPLTAFALAFGGLCVFLQVLPDLKTLKCPLGLYFLYRTVSGTISYIVMYCLLKTFPQAIQTVQKTSISILPKTNSLPLIFSLLLMTVVFMASSSDKVSTKPV